MMELRLGAEVECRFWSSLWVALPCKLLRPVGKKVYPLRRMTTYHSTASFDIHLEKRTNSTLLHKKKNFSLCSIVMTTIRLHVFLGCGFCCCCFFTFSL